jgi:uracil-DNA glycosylase
LSKNRGDIKMTTKWESERTNIVAQIWLEFAAYEPAEYLNNQQLIEEFKRDIKDLKAKWKQKAVQSSYGFRVEEGHQITVII